MAAPPRTRRVEWYEPPVSIALGYVGAKAVPESASAVRRSADLPVRRVTPRGRDVVMLPNGQELELP